MNFGGFATPERRIVFGINDFDETLPAPWEWELKRLACSFVIAARRRIRQTRRARHCGELREKLPRALRDICGNAGAGAMVPAARR